MMLTVIPLSFFLLLNRLRTGEVLGKDSCWHDCYLMTQNSVSEGNSNGKGNPLG